MSPIRAVATSLGVVLLLTSATGCANRRTAAELRGAEYAVRKVKFEGVERFEPKDIHAYLELRPTEWRPLPEKHYFYEGLLPIDERHIVDLYAAYGYFDARVVDVRVEYIDRKRRSKVDLTYVIEEGEPTVVEDVVVRWPEGPPPGPPADERVSGAFADPPEIDVDALSKRVQVRVGQNFEVERIRRSKRAIERALNHAGHPFAKVSERAQVDTNARVARVSFEVRPGPFMRVGEIAIEGLETVPEKPVRVEMEFTEGERVSPRLLDRLEKRVHALDVFSTVSVSTDETDEDGDGRLDMTVKVREADPQRIRLGVALGLEPNRWDQRAIARYQNVNLFRNLYRLSLTAGAGYAELPNPFNPVEHGPIADLGLHVEKKGLLEKHLVWTVDPKLEHGVEQGYRYWSTSHRFGLARFFSRWFELELAHSLRYVNFSRVSPTLNTDTSVLGLDFRDPYVISYIDVRPTLYGVDDISAPNDGVALGVQYRVAGGPFGGDFDYQELSPFLRAYWRPIERLQFALRGRVGMIFPFGDRPGAPIDLRRYLGGTDTVRGWGLKRLSPRIGCEDATGDCTTIPVGGNTSVLGNFEVRVRTWRKLWVAGFVDMGDVREGVLDFRPAQWNYSSGGGLRYDSPIGKFRLDVGFRLNETELSAGEPIWALHFGLGESF